MFGTEFLCLFQVFDGIKIFLALNTEAVLYFSQFKLDDTIYIDVRSKFRLRRSTPYIFDESMVYVTGYILFYACKIFCVEYRRLSYRKAGPIKLDENRYFNRLQLVVSRIITYMHVPISYLS